MVGRVRLHQKPYGVKNGKAGHIRSRTYDAGLRFYLFIQPAGHAELLRGHIAKEDEVFYPLAERVIPGSMKDAIIDGYRAAETKTPPDFTHRYEAVVSTYENES